MGRRSWSTTPEVTPWLLVCCGLGVTVVYAFEQQFYEAIVFVTGGVGYLMAMPFGRAAESFTSHTIDMTQSIMGILIQLLVMLVVSVILVVIGLVIVVALLVLMIPWGLAYLLATHPGPPRYLLDLFLVWYVGAFLYGVFFPILWRLSEPVIAHTLGELAFQRARSRIYGEQPRYAQPLYLVIALMGLIGGIGRVALPATGAAATAAATGWHQLSDPVFRPEWPKGFMVAAGAHVATNIHLQPNEEVILYTDGAVDASIEPGGTHYQVTPRTWTAPWGFDGRRGDLHFWGGPRPVTVFVSGPPENHGRTWARALATPTPQRAASRRHARRATGHR